MKIEKTLLLIIMIITTLLGGYYYYNYLQYKTKKNKHGIKIGILQAASHPALDKAREGFIAKMQSALGDNIDFVIRNSEGSSANNFVIAESFHSHEDIVGIFAIATPAAQAIASVEKEKPIFISAITDHTQLNIGNNQNICGGSDKINIPATIKMIKTLIPHAKKVALISYTGNANSEKEIIEIEHELKKAGLISTRIGFNTEADVPGAIISACGKGDVILTPNYNIIASAMPLVSSIALENNIPLVACYPSSVEQGAFAAHGIDYFINGEQAADCALEVFLNNKKPHELPITFQEGSSFINKKVAQKLGIVIPELFECNYC